MTQTINQMRALKSSRISEKNEMMNAIEAKPSMKFEDRVGFVGLVIVQGAL
jgi:hypothetical protein